MTQDTPPPDAALARLAAALSEVPKGALPPVETWHPQSCGRIDMRIAADGTWFHEGAPIRRLPLVRLFSTILRREPDGGFVLVTPVEMLSIRVDDAPFAAVEMAVEGEGEDRRIAFRTNVDDLVPVDDAHALRFEEEAGGGLRPYVHVRRDLWALLTRALAHDLVGLAEEREIDGEPAFGIFAGGRFHRIGQAGAA
ncbi:DUF1285 domain-containing protein [Methylobacterium sp. sgz302541]|uniref:DUF1285 domain-containing protein n=1 Tax=unclassified Methylobacterium TaxID=2615210 RepID=UPI003D34D672